MRYMQRYLKDFSAMTTSTKQFQDWRNVLSCYVAVVGTLTLSSNHLLDQSSLMCRFPYVIYRSLGRINRCKLISAANAMKWGKLHAFPSLRLNKSANEMVNDAKYEASGRISRRFSRGNWSLGADMLDAKLAKYQIKASSKIKVNILKQGFSWLGKLTMEYAEKT